MTNAIANSIGADLFLSIHLNAADDEVERGGVTTFVLDTSDDRQALRLAARENGTTVDEVDSLARLLAQLHRSDQVAASRDVAEQVHRATLEAGRRHLPSLHDRGVKSALFYVLVGALSGIGVVLHELNDPFRGPYRITPSTSQLVSVRRELDESLCAEADAQTGA